MKNKTSVLNKKSHPKMKNYSVSQGEISMQDGVKESDSKIKPQSNNTQKLNKNGDKKKFSLYTKIKNTIKKWFASRPATKAAWTDASASLIAAILAFLTLIVTSILNYYIISQNSDVIKNSQESVKTAQESFISSISASINIDFPKEWEEQNIQIQNTSPYPLINVDVYLTQYKIEKDEVLQRSLAEKPVSHFEILEKKQIVSLKSPDVFQFVNYGQFTGNEFYFFAIVSYRTVDNKKIFHIEPFGAATLEEQITFFPLFSGKGNASGGPPKRLIKILDEIEMIEKKLFRYDEK